ncbi:uncharacterized protein LOC129918752 isoform X2 [Episyrphus balteatus]|nr:uncharacterized protein LOC129918752 isoform X2 [Episyrphus balteatus]
MDVESLILLKEEDMKEIFGTNMLGTRIKLRTCLNQWQQQHKSQKLTLPRRLPVVVPPAPRASEVIPSPAIIQSMISSSPRIHNDHRPSLFNLLQSSFKGQFVLKFFEENKKLMDEQRVALVNSIVDYYKDREIAMTLNDIIRTTAEIGVLFPSEETRYYYSARKKGRNPVGKLYDKAINARRKIKKNRPDNNNATTPGNIYDFDEIPSKDELDTKSWLSQNLKPWNEVLNKWKQTFRIRRADVLKGEDVFQNWPLFKNPMGYNLIDIDFYELHPESPRDLSNEWEFFSQSILPYLRHKIKDTYSRELMEKLDGDISTDSKYCMIILLLHAVIKPPFISINVSSSDNDGNKKRKWKPTISDAQNATVMHCLTEMDFQIKYEELKSEASQNNTILQPILAVIGEDLTDLESFYVLYDCILYKVDTFIKSLDILFKIYYVMNFEFRVETKHVYEFIESYFYKIKSPSNPNIISLINYINDNKKL